MGKITTEIAVADIEESLQFYNALGFTKDNTGIVDEKGSQWYSLALGDAGLWLIRRDIVEDLDVDEAVGNGVNIYISVDDVDAVYEQVKTGGLQMNIIKDIETLWYGLRQFSLADPDGYMLTINMPVEQQEGAEAGGEN
jgi:uncharacterized glyoxalase superfamily protein PhnB